MPESLIRKSFRECGLLADVSNEDLHSRLKCILGMDQEEPAENAATESEEHTGLTDDESEEIEDYGAEDDIEDTIDDEE